MLTRKKMIQLESINLVLDKKCIFLKWFKLLSLFFDLKGEKKSNLTTGV